jgi:hypothetical protein
MGKLYFYQKNGRSHGPFTSSDLRDFAAAGELSGDDLIRTQDTQKWTTAYKIKNLFAMDSGPSSGPAVASPLPEKSATSPVRSSKAAAPADHPNSTHPAGTRSGSVPPGLPPSGLRALAGKGSASSQVSLLLYCAGVVGVVSLFLLLVAKLPK